MTGYSLQVVQAAGSQISSCRDVVQSRRCRSYQIKNWIELNSTAASSHHLRVCGGEGQWCKTGPQYCKKKFKLRRWLYS